MEVRVLSPAPLVLLERRRPRAVGITHTAGFDERLFIGMVARGPEDVGPLGENLARHLPPRIRPPGQMHQYDNHGMALAGHLVEELSGRSFDDGEPAPGAAERTGAFTGTYRWTRRDRHTFMSLASTLLTPTMEVSADGDGTLRTTMSPWQLIADARWVEDGPGVFREAGWRLLGFHY